MTRLVTLNDIQSQYRRGHGARALVRLMNQCRCLSDSTLVVRDALRSLHNGALYPLDFELAVKRLDQRTVEDILAVARYYKCVLWPHVELYGAFESGHLFKSTLFPDYDEYGGS